MLSASMMDRFAHRRIAVLGDSILDTFVVGECVKLCREAPVPVIANNSVRDCPGGAANTAANLAALGADVRLVSVVGEDAAGERLMRALERGGVGTSAVVRQRVVTPHKQRILAGDEYIARIDEGGGTPPRAGACDALTRSLKEAMHECEALVVSDYALGCVCDRTLHLVDRMRARRPVVVDTREMTSAARVHATVVTPNLEEACNATGHPVRTLASPTEFEELARSVRRVANSEAAA
ncbi:MAG TPA: PfkB family carbohydrate kinase, partial [Candidatus Aquilonibacter sp.]|nr:PfkB family carbohydrate kinase [Candidatus Aquilonibacter sp.]